MRYGCPNKNCQYHRSLAKITKQGRYFRRNDSRWVNRFKCTHCGRNFSNATFSPAFAQKKRRVNDKVRTLLCARVSMRRIAKILGIHRITVARKLIFLSQQAQIKHELFLEKIVQTPVHSMQFDDLITKEHTKMKPLTVTLAVDGDTRAILGAEVSQIAAFGLLADKSRKKYGKRISHHQQGIDALFSKIQKCIASNAEIRSDEHNLYEHPVKRYFPNAKHKRYKGGRGCIAGQGELKKLHFDPLFTLNHTCAMLRANINRLIRKTWCTTKLPERLQAHLNIYIEYHNSELI